MSVNRPGLLDVMEGIHPVDRLHPLPVARTQQDPRQVDAAPGQLRELTIPDVVGQDEIDAHQQHSEDSPFQRRLDHFVESLARLDVLGVDEHGEVVFVLSQEPAQLTQEGLILAAIADEDLGSRWRGATASAAEPPSAIFWTLDSLAHVGSVPEGRSRPTRPTARRSHAFPLADRPTMTAQAVIGEVRPILRAPKAFRSAWT